MTIFAPEEYTLSDFAEDAGIARTDRAAMERRGKIFWCCFHQTKILTDLGGIEKL